MLPQTGNIQFRKPCRKFFCQTSEKFLLKIGIYLDEITLKKNLPRISFWQVKYCLDKPAWNFLAKWLQKICQISKVIQLDGIFRKKVSANCFSGQVECSFDDCARKIFEQRPKLLSKVSGNLRNWKSYFGKKYFPKMFQWRGGVQVWRPCRKFFIKWPKKFYSKSESNFEKVFLSKKILLFKIFFWTGRLQFWRNCRKFLVKVENSSVQFPKKFKDSNFFYRKKFFSKRSSWHMECCFDKPADHF